MISVSRFVTTIIFVLLVFTTMAKDARAANDDHPMNVEYSSLDENGFAKNPIWSFQITHANDDPPFPAPLDLCDHFAVANTDDQSHPSLGNPPCTNQPFTVDYPRGFHDFACVNFGGNAGSLHGHVDWVPAQYSGILYWGSVNHWYQLGDGDFNFALAPEHGAGLTKDNFRAVAGGRVALGVEFDSAEVGSHWGSAWWKQFRKGSDEQRRALIDGSRAIVWGLLGVDTEHYAHSELHPVYAMAIEDPHSTSEDDIWHFFVRNWGNEGFCSQFDHALPDNATMQIFLPRPGAKGGVLSASDVSSEPRNLVWRFASVASGALLTLELGNATKKHLFDGEMHIRWTAESQGPGLNLVLSLPVDTGLQLRARELGLTLPPEEERTTEDATGQFWKKLTNAQKQEVSDKLGEDEPSHAGKALEVPPRLAHLPKQPFAFIAPGPRPRLARTVEEVDQQKIDRDLVRSRLICRFEFEKQEWPVIRQDQCTALEAH